MILVDPSGERLDSMRDRFGAADTSRDHREVLGKVDQLEPILQASDLFFLPSRGEGVGL